MIDGKNEHNKTVATIGRNMIDMITHANVRNMMKLVMVA